MLPANGVCVQDYVWELKPNKNMHLSLYEKECTAKHTAS